MKTIPVLIAFLFGFFHTAIADDAQILDYKQKIMQSNANHMQMIGLVLQKDLPFKDQIASQAEVIKLNLMMFAEASKMKIVEGKTDSEPAIWENWSAFQKAAEEAEKAAQNLARADQAGLMQGVRELGGSCGGCHRSFRKPKSERFER
jgi:cytochrome c556